ncbi:hypothetical protein C6P46_006970 [Rhodotorula mucilaginosa]|uniref:Uncharacterized protein n=1 Tax=Rhodotorula mucilaginosa TaxID=5537 RepID=A0A9P6VW56_RHOMI|nr:hypothetical protein C6P46_006970 [Rhodotorula mucilaginosa]
MLGGPANSLYAFTWASRLLPPLCSSAATKQPAPPVGALAGAARRPASSGDCRSRSSNPERRVGAALRAAGVPGPEPSRGGAEPVLSGIELEPIQQMHLALMQLNSLSAAVFHARLLLPCICRFRFGEPTPPVPDERPRLAAEGRSALCPPHPTTKRCLRSDDGRRESTPPSIPAYAEAATPSDSKRIGAAPRRGSASAGEDHPAKVTMLRPVPLAQVVEVRSS